MAIVKDFDRELEKLTRLRTAEVRFLIRPARRGRRSKLTKARLQQHIDRLLVLAHDILVRHSGRTAFRNTVQHKRQWHVKRGKGHGIENKKRSFKDWYLKEIYGSNCVYVFWSNRKCEYVGRTGRGGSRPHSHFEKWWMWPVTRIDVYEIRIRRELPKAECLAIHIFEPRRNKVRSSRQKYASRCPVCSRTRTMRTMLGQIFNLRKAKRRAPR